MIPAQATFAAWASRWLELARYDGRDLTDAASRIDELIKLWAEPVPGDWLRGVDQQLLAERYRRGDVAAPRPGEHCLEYEVLCDPGCTRCLDEEFVDGVNAMPLVRDAYGGRDGNVEADLYLLTRGADSAHRLVLCEVKAPKNNAWYAAVENLRQLKLLTLSPAAQQLFCDRKSLSSSTPPAVAGLVVARSSFYSASGQRAESVPHARKLFRRLRDAHGVDAELAVWDRDTREIRVLEPQVTDPRPG